MRLRFFIPVFLTQLFLIFMLIAGIMDTYNVITNYGWFYDKIIVIQGKAITHTVNMWYQQIPIIFIAWLIAMIFILLVYIQKLENQKGALPNGQEKEGQTQGIQPID